MADEKEEGGGFLGKLKDKMEDLGDKVQDAVGKVDDKLEDASEKEGILGKIAGAAHKVADKLDGEN